MKRTVKELAVDQKWTHVEANAFVCVARKGGLIQIVDTIRKPSTNGKPVKGKAANVYEIPASVTFKLY